VLAFAPSACGEDGPSGAATDASSESSAGSNPTTVPTASNPSASASASAEGDASTADPSGAPTTADTTAAADTGTATTTADTGDETGDGELDDNGCPVGSPTSWVGCEDFNDISDPATQIAEWLVMGDAFGVDPDDGDPDDRALRITLTPGMQFGGWVTLRWGVGPDGPGVDSPTDSFDEIWVRYSLRTGPDWPGRAIGDVGEIIAMNGPNWAIATEMAIRGEAPMRLHPLGWTCIFNGQLGCDGNNDWSGGLQLIWQQVGPSVLFDAANAGQWRCLEAHMRLNTPGASDGEAHVWIDGAEEIAVDGVNFRGTWTDYGLNALRFTNYASPPNVPLDYWVDDVVIATERIGCD